MNKTYYLILFFIFNCFSTCFCDEPKPISKPEDNPLVMTYRTATREEILSLSKNKKMSKNETNYIRNCPVISLEIKNAKPGEEFFLFRRDSLGFVNPIGKDPKKTDSKILVVLDGYYMPGESTDIIAASSDKTRVAAVHVIPSPIEAKGQKNNRKLSIESCSSDRLFYIAHIEGFEPDEPIKITSKSGYETKTLEAKFPADKKMDFSISPIVPGKSYGTAIVEVQANNPDEVLHVEFEWGVSKELLNKMRERSK